MQHRVPSTITSTRCSIRLPTLAVLQALSAQRSLVYHALIRPRKRHAIILELNDCRNGFLRHVVYCILVAEPVRALDCVVHVPTPVVFCHIAQRGVDASLCGYGVRSCGEKFRYACCLQSGFGEAYGGAKASASCSYDESAGQCKQPVLYVVF